MLNPPDLYEQQVSNEQTSAFDSDVAVMDIYLFLIRSCCSLFTQNAVDVHLLHTLLQSYKNLATYLDMFKTASANALLFKEPIEWAVNTMLKKFEKKLCKEANSNYRQLQFELIGQSCKLIQCYFAHLPPQHMEFFGEKVMFSLRRLIHRFYEMKKVKKLGKVENYALNRCFSLMSRIIRCNFTILVFIFKLK